MSLDRESYRSHPLGFSPEFGGRNDPSGMRIGIGSISGARVTLRVFDPVLAEHTACPRAPVRVPLEARHIAFSSGSIPVHDPAVFEAAFIR